MRQRAFRSVMRRLAPKTEADGNRTRSNKASMASVMLFEAFLGLSDA